MGKNHPTALRLITGEAVDNQLHDFATEILCHVI